MYFNCLLLCSFDGKLASPLCNEYCVPVRRLTKLEAGEATGRRYHASSASVSDDVAAVLCGPIGKHVR